MLRVALSHGTAADDHGFCFAADPIHSLAWHPILQYLVALAVGPRVLVTYASPDQEGPFGVVTDCDPRDLDGKDGIAAFPFVAAGDVTSIAFSDDGLLLAAGSHDGQVRLHPRLGWASVACLIANANAWNVHVRRSRKHHVLSGCISRLEASCMAGMCPCPSASEWNIAWQTGHA